MVYLSNTRTLRPVDSQRVLVYFGGMTLTVLSFTAEVDGGWDGETTITLKLGNTVVKTWEAALYEPDRSDIEEFIAGKFGELFAMASGEEVEV